MAWGRHGRPRSVRKSRLSAADLAAYCGQRPKTEAKAGRRRVAAPVAIKVLSTTAMKMVFEELSPRFERETGNRLEVQLGPSLVLEKRLTDGETADVAIVTGPGAADLVARGKLAAGSLTDIAHSLIGVAVPKGAPRPDLSSVEGFKQSLLAAK